VSDTTTIRSNDRTRWVLVWVLVLVAFFGAYRFATAGTRQASTVPAAQTFADPASPAAVPAGGSGDSAAAPACACCGGGAPTENGLTGPKVEGAAVVEAGVQRISIDVSGVYNPNSVKLKAGVPAEITFSQSDGCTQYVDSADLGFSEDLSGGPKTVKLQGLQPGTYAFYCGMQMVFGQIIVE